MALAQVTKMETTIDALRLFRFGKPLERQGKLCYFAIDHVVMATDRIRVLRIKNRRFLAGKSEADARKIFEQAGQRFKARQESIRRKLEARPQTPHEQAAQEALQSAKFAHLAKGYPKTIRLLKGRASAEQTYWAFVEEVAKVTGGLPTAIPTPELVRRIAAHWEARKKRKNQHYFDPVECALIIGCEFKGYGVLPWNSILEDVKTVTGIKALNLNSLRQKWGRLKLPSSRKRGRK